MFIITKKKFALLSVICVAVLALFAVLVCALPQKKICLNFSACFYYVCYDSPNDSTSASSVSSLVHSYGGAGYTVMADGCYYVVVSCYYDEKDAQSVCKTLSAKGLNCSVKKVEAGDYQLDQNQKDLTQKYTDNLNTMLSISRMCYELANGIDGYSCGQDKAKGVLSSIRISLEGLACSNYGNCFYDEICNLISECDDAVEGYIFSCDVRRLQVAVCDSITNVPVGKR